MKRVSVGDFHLGEDEKKAILKVLDSGRISEGKQVREFEKNWAHYIGTKYCISLSSGTAALMVGWWALRYYKQYKGNHRRKVITSPITYIATSNALVLTELEPIYVDIDPNIFVITPENIKKHLAKVKDPENYLAINPVHLMGYICDMNEINKIATEYNLAVVEDSAQAHGSIYHGHKAGSMSLFSIYSFYIAHNIQAGEMGALNTNDIEIYKLVKKLKANGRLCDCLVCTRHEGKCPHMSLDEEDHDPRFTHDLIGANFKTMEFQAALAVTQLKKVDEIFKKRQDNVKYLNEKLKKYSSILQLPLYSENISYLAFPIVIKDPKIISRKELRYKLEKAGIENRPLFGCIPTQQLAYAHFKNLYQGKLPNAEYIGNNGFYIGCHQYMGKQDIDYIAEVFDQILNNLS
jgi:CDP-6-deoxy-D-xylo-4-hexulose-3-dehydrase